MLALIGAMLMTGTLGSVHAFSIFVAPLELLLDASRAQVSLLYSFALVFLTIAVLAGHKIYPLATPPRVAAWACGVAAAGLFLCASSRSVTLLWIGYSVLFGAANGVGYGFSLQIAAQAMPARKGFAMGAVTAVYAVGATLFAKLFAMLIPAFGVAITFGFMGVIMSVVAACVFVVLRASGAVYRTSAAANEPGSGRPSVVLVLLWAGYGFGAAAGLMAIAHAAGIVAAAGGDQEQWVLGAMLIGAGNAVGGFSAGWLADRWAVRRLLTVLPLISAATLIVLAYSNAAHSAIISLCVVGFSYGAIIAVYPYAASGYFGANAAARTYGRVFTAWGLAGLAAPWIAGWVYDWSGGYRYALLLASSAGFLSACAACLLPVQPVPPAQPASSRA